MRVKIRYRSSGRKIGGPQDSVPYATAFAIPQPAADLVALRCRVPGPQVGSVDVPGRQSCSQQGSVTEIRFDAEDLAEVDRLVNGVAR